MSTKKKTVKVTLAKPHTHAGKPRKEGAEIEVTPRQAQWLAERGTIKTGAGGYQPVKTDGPKGHSSTENKGDQK
ncbi:hypothetical protein [Alcanivorax sp.]|uniref:DUF7210 family protein n=1 Tax=Alcanivorax sp. TaxID=1872427 RepID=UPI000C0F2493|nr:hypothetical protein [Alcanivorax sp.]PHR68503.1 MAG: hypothetical protein COA55_00350 [Alcanivorax sp.]